MVYPFLTCALALICFVIVAKFIFEISVVPVVIPGLVGGICCSGLSYCQQKQNDKKREGKKMQTKYLTKKLEEEKEKLEQLKMNKANTKKTNDFCVSQINKVENPSKLISSVVFFNDLGRNEQKYFNAYEKGVLEESLRGRVSEEDIQFVNQHFKEKGSVLQKIRKFNKK